MDAELVLDWEKVEEGDTMLTGFICWGTCWQNLKRVSNHERKGEIENDEFQQWLKESNYIFLRSLWDGNTSPVVSKRQNSTGMSCVDEEKIASKWEGVGILSQLNCRLPAGIG